MVITLSLVGKTPVMHLAGRLDATTSSLLEDRLKPLLDQSGEQIHRIVFDCSALTYVSSAGLRVFIATQRSLMTQAGSLAFACLTPAVHELFHLSGLDGIFVIELTVDKAVINICSGK